MHDSRDAVSLARALFPELAAELDAAYAEHGGGADRSDAGESLDAWIDRQADLLRASGGAGSAFDALPDAGARERFARAFAAARAAFAPAGLAVPEPEAFADAGVDLAALDGLLASDAELVPVPAPYGLGAEAWLRLFRDAAARGIGPLARSSAPGGTAGSAGSGGSAGPGGSAGTAEEEEILVLASDIRRDFGELDRIPDPALPSVAGDPLWTLRLIPAGPRPEALGLSFAHGPHPSLPEMLALQLMRLAEGRDPLDAESFTWIAGALAGGRLAARHVFDRSAGVIRITAREPGNQGPHLGTRRPRA